MMDSVTRVTDPTTIEQIRTWLAEQLCPYCEGEGSRDLPCKECDDGLAFLWASEPCGDWFGAPGKPASWQEGGGHKGHDKCNGSGRVPKALELEELIEVQPGPVTKALRDEYYRPYGGEDHRERFLLAALRAVAKQAGMPL